MEPIKLLLVDDRPENLLTLEATFTSPEYILHCAHSGEEALLRILTEDYAVILLDAQMQGLDGIETAELIRRREKSHDIPILLLSAINKTAEHEARGYAAGALDFVFKPFHPDTLRAKVKALADMYNKSLLLSRQNEQLERMVAKRTAELVQANEEVMQSHQQIATLLGSITDAFFAVDQSWRFVYVNEEAQAKFRRTRQRLIGQVIWDIVPLPVPLRQELIQARDERKSINWEIQSESSKSWHSVRTYPTTDGLLVYVQDITEKRKAEREIARLDRMHLVGEMAIGLAHEIRNPMTTVRGFLQFLKRKFIGYEDEMDLMVDELDRANNIIVEFLSLAKNKASSLTDCDLSQIAKNVVPLLQVEAVGSGKKVAAELDNTLEIKADPGEISQLILNISMNGLESMPPGGTLTIKSFRDKEGAVLAIQDEGGGIKPDVLDKLGTPFFSTKDTGTGLGLAVCYSIASRHKALIQVKTGRNGTTFYVKFPA